MDINTTNKENLEKAADLLHEALITLGKVEPCPETETKYEDYTTFSISIPENIMSRGYLEYFGSKTQISPVYEDVIDQVSKNLPEGAFAETNLFNNNLNIVWFIPKDYSSERVFFKYTKLSGQSGIRFGSYRHKGLLCPNLAKGEFCAEHFKKVNNLVNGFDFLYIDYDDAGDFNTIPSILALKGGKKIYLRNLGGSYTTSLKDQLIRNGWDYVNVTA